MVTGIDIVREQLRIAGGAPLSFAQDDVEIDGHAIEVRINAERPEAGFLPSPGRIERWAAPVSRDVRVDTACFPGWTVAPYYDSLLAKVIARGDDRAHALQRIDHALRHLRVEGVATTAAFALDVLEHPDVVSGRVHTRWLEEEFLPGWTPKEEAA
jgi:acetyl-CoA carboxylase biotin carboxylase subunit